MIPFVFSLLSIRDLSFPTPLECNIIKENISYSNYTTNISLILSVPYKKHIFVEETKKYLSRAFVPFQFCVTVDPTTPSIFVLKGKEEINRITLSNKNALMEVIGNYINETKPIINENDKLENILKLFEFTVLASQNKYHTAKHLIESIHIAKDRINIINVNLKNVGKDNDMIYLYSRSTCEYSNVSTLGELDTYINEAINEITFSDLKNIKKGYVFTHIGELQRNFYIHMTKNQGDSEKEKEKNHFYILNVNDAALISKHVTEKENSTALLVYGTEWKYKHVVYSSGIFAEDESFSFFSENGIEHQKYEVDYLNGKKWPGEVKYTIPTFILYFNGMDGKRAIEVVNNVGRKSKLNFALFNIDYNTPKGFYRIVKGRTPVIVAHIGESFAAAYRREITEKGINDFTEEIMNRISGNAAFKKESKIFYERMKDENYNETLKNITEKLSFDIVMRRGQDDSVETWKTLNEITDTSNGLFPCIDLYDSEVSDDNKGSLTHNFIYSIFGKSNEKLLTSIFQYSKNGCQMSENQIAGGTTEGTDVDGRHDY